MQYILALDQGTTSSRALLFDENGVVRSVAQRVVEKIKQAGFRPHGVEGQQDGDWVLIDLNEIIVHVMLPRVREFYGLEKLWDMTATKRAARA